MYTNGSGEINVARCGQCQDLCFKFQRTLRQENNVQGIYLKFPILARKQYVIPDRL